MAGYDEDGVGPSRSESYITIDGTRMKVGQAIHTKGRIVAKKGELEKIFGRNWKSGIVEGKLLGLGKKSVKTMLNGPPFNLILWQCMGRNVEFSGGKLTAYAPNALKLAYL